MNLSKLKRQLRREATKNPKKAAFLGIIFVVALWFWSPLIMGWLDKKNPSAAAAPHAAKPNIAPTVTLGAGSTAPSAAKPAHHPWSQLARWMDADRLTLAVGLPDAGRDPFRASESSKDEAIRHLSEQMSAEDVTPKSLGMVLSSTIIGPQRRVALIDGKPYRHGQPVLVKRGDREIEFTIETIDSRLVVLQRNGERFELRIESEKLPGRIQQAN